jgi:uncharacterized protein
MSFKIAFLELPALDINRATAFYSQLMHVPSPNLWEDGVRKVSMILDDGAGAGVGMSLNQTANFEPSNKGPLAYLHVEEDLDALMARVQTLGGKVLAPKTDMGMGNGSYYAIFEDTEGNALAVYKEYK